MQKQKGFTLVELVVVIVILGILAATALPRFVNLTSDARISTVNGFAGGLRSAVAVSQARYMATGNTAATAISMSDGTTVLVSSGVNGGIPTGASGGIGAAMQSTDGFSVSYGSPTTFQPTNGGGANCQASYAPATGIVTVTTSGC